MGNKRIRVAAAFTADLLLLPLVPAAPTETPFDIILSCTLYG